MACAPGWGPLTQAKLEARTCTHISRRGRRIGAAEAAALRVVDEAVDAEQVLPRAIERAAALAPKNRTVYAQLKRDLYAPAIALLEAASLV
jgi:enoyl-CoA hydratase/carnithine racemase